MYNAIAWFFAVALTRWMRGFGRLATHLLINLADLSLSFVLESRHFGCDKMMCEVFANAVVVSATRELLLSFGDSESKWSCVLFQIWWEIVREEGARNLWRGRTSIDRHLFVGLATCESQANFPRSLNVPSPIYKINLYLLISM